MCVCCLLACLRFSLAGTTREIERGRERDRQVSEGRQREEGNLAHSETYAFQPTQPLPPPLRPLLLTLQIQLLLHWTQTHALHFESTSFRLVRNGSSGQHDSAYVIAWIPLVSVPGRQFLAQLSHTHKRRFALHFVRIFPTLPNGASGSRHSQDMRC